MNKLNLTAIKINEDTGVKQVVLLYEDANEETQQKILLYDDLSAEDKATCDAFETMSNTLMNA
jgi:hypothetical protein